MLVQNNKVIAFGFSFNQNVEIFYDNEEIIIPK
jgi:hypothetical protein